MRLFALLLVAAIAACAGPSPQELAACSLERKAELPLRVRRGVPIVTAVVNGQPATMLVDTGADITVMTPAAAVRLGLARERRADMALAGVSGMMPGAGALARSFALGDAVLPDRIMVVGPLVLPAVDGQPIDGLLGTSLLSEYDIDLDLPSERMTLYRARPCPGAVPAWSGAFTQVAMAGSSWRRLYVPLQLDGTALASLLDTGTSITTVSRRAALAMGATEDELARAPAVVSASGAPGGFASRVRRFRELRVGADTRRGPILLVGELPVSAGDALLGGDYLTTRRLWLSFANGEVFVPDGIGQPRPR